MAPSDSKAFLRELDKNREERDGLPVRAARSGSAAAQINRGTATDRLRSNLDAVVPGQDKSALGRGFGLPRRDRRGRQRRKQSYSATWRLAASRSKEPDRIDSALIDAVAERHPVQFILDRALQGNDSLKGNTQETFRSAQPEIRFRAV